MNDSDRGPGSVGEVYLLLRGSARCFAAMDTRFTQRANVVALIGTAGGMRDDTRQTSD